MRSQQVAILAAMHGVIGANNVAKLTKNVFVGLMMQECHGVCNPRWCSDIYDALTGANNAG